MDELPSLDMFSGSTTLKRDLLASIVQEIAPEMHTSRKSKRDLLTCIQEYRIRTGLSNAELCDFLASRIYLPQLRPETDRIPASLLNVFPELTADTPAA